MISGLKIKIKTGKKDPRDSDPRAEDGEGDTNMGTTATIIAIAQPDPTSTATTDHPNEEHMS